jgi:hypothetical protein
MSRGVKQGCLVLAIVTAIYVFSRGGNQPGASRTEPESPGQDAASVAIVEHFKSSAEPWAKDAMWSTANTLKIGVLNTRQVRRRPRTVRL